MSALFRKKALGFLAAEVSSPPRQHRPHRHKKFSVRPQALGEGYENYDVLVPSSSASPPERPGPDATPAEEEMTVAIPVSIEATPASGWERDSEQDLRWLAARNALRWGFWGFSSLILLVLLCAYSDWLWRVLEWLRHFPPPLR